MDSMQGTFPLLPSKQEPALPPNILCCQKVLHAIQPLAFLLLQQPSRVLTLSISSLIGRGRLSSEPALSLAKKEGYSKADIFREKGAPWALLSRSTPSSSHSESNSTLTQTPGNGPPVPKVFCQQPAEGALDNSPLLRAHLPSEEDRVWRGSTSCENYSPATSPYQGRKGFLLLFWGLPRPLPTWDL